VGNFGCPSLEIIDHFSLGAVADPQIPRSWHVHRPRWGAILLVPLLWNTRRSLDLSTRAADGIFAQGRQLGCKDARLGTEFDNVEANGLYGGIKRGPGRTALSLPSALLLGHLELHSAPRDHSQAGVAK